MSQAENQANIARKVYPDLTAYDRGKGKCILYAVSGGSEMYLREFNLLEVDDKGNPTQQAKASAFDTWCWLVENRDTDNEAHYDRMELITVTDYIVEQENPCEAIYKAALEVIKAGE